MTTIANIATAMLQEGGYIQDSTSVTVTPAMVKAENGYPATTSDVTVTASAILAENGYMTGTSEVEITATLLLAENGYLASTSDVTVTANLILAENGFLEDTGYADVTSTKVLQENNYSSTDDIADTKVEYLVDNAINYVNLQTGANIPALSGIAGSKTVSVYRNQAVVIKSLAALMIRAYLDRGPNVSIGSISAATVIADPQYSLHSDIIKTGIQKLKTLSSINIEYLMDNAINYVNMQANTSISALSGTPGSKTVSLDRNEATIIKSLTAKMLKSALDEQTSPDSSIIDEIIKAGISRLQTLSATNIEYLIDNAINYINLQANTGISALSGTVGSKTVNVNRNEAAVIKSLSALLLTATLDSTLTTNTGESTISSVLNNPKYAIHSDLVKSGIVRLKTLSSINIEYLIDNAINYINVQANTSISALSGTPGSKKVDVDRNEATIIKSLTALMIKSALDGTGANPSLHDDMMKAGISRLQTLSDTNVGYLIDNAIGYVNSQTGLQMSLLAAGSATLTGSQASVVKLIAGIQLKVALSRGGEVSLQTVTKDPQHSIYAQMIADAVNGLQTIKVDYIEQVLDDAIRYINSEAGISIAALSGAAGSKSLVGTDAQIAAVKALGKNMLREATGQKMSDVHKEILNKTIQRLRGRTLLKA